MIKTGHSDNRISGYGWCGKGGAMKRRLIAVVDDEPDIVEGLIDYLTHEGFRVRGFLSASDLFKFLKEDNKKPDLIILDLMLPGMSGFDVCEALKQRKGYSSIPIIILSADCKSNDKVKALDMGAVDYVTKPFSSNELSARIRAILRRQKPREQTSRIDISDMIVLDLRGHSVTSCGKKVELTLSEFNLLKLLFTQKDRVFSRDQILRHLWDGKKDSIERTVDTHINHLREKLGKAGKFIKNVRGIGYKFEEDI
jgi:DNA-binding response OmpR family regulator